MITLEPYTFNTKKFNMMKKYLTKMAVCLAGAALLTACDNEDETTPLVVPVTNGVYIVGSGNSSSGISGNLTYFDFNTEKATVGAFKQANGIELGKTANDALQYGSKLYIVVDGENTVFVVNGKTLQVIKAISTTELLGDEAGVSPRRITAVDGNIYFSTYGGYVAAVDTTDFQLVNKYKAGSYPEGIIIVKNILYVANSDYGQGKNASISMIDLKTGSETVIKNENIRNPQTVAVADNGTIYYLDYGLYGPAPDYEQMNAGLYKYENNTSTKLIADVTGIGCATTRIYAYSALYGKEVKFYLYDLASENVFPLSPEGIESPAAIEVDPNSGAVYIASYHMTTSEWGTFADYSGNGYVNVYSKDLATKYTTFDCGVGPTRIVFNLGTQTVK